MKPERGNAGLTFPPGDAAALAETMERILDEPDSWSSLAVLARERVFQSFSLGGMLNTHARVYRALNTRH